MEKKLTKVMIPRNSYNSLHRALTNSNQPVLALGSVFSKEADSHLVAMQRGDEDDGQQSQHLGVSQSDYETQAINIANKDRVGKGLCISITILHEMTLLLLGVLEFIQRNNLVNFFTYTLVLPCNF